LAVQIEFCLEHPQRAKEMAFSAQKNLPLDFDARLMAERIQELYEKLLAEKGVI
jgi:hypothetical protein